MTDFYANWPAPKNISALTTTRLNGLSQPPYEGNNMALHVGDNEQTVLINRQQLTRRLALPGEPAWLFQTHSNHCINIDLENHSDADAAVTQCNEKPLVIMTADCLPVLLCDTKGTEIAAIHAGWRGLAHGIVESTLVKMNNPAHSLIAWLGPSICGECFEIGDEVYHVFQQRYPFSIEAFRAHGFRWLADLHEIARLILVSQGVQAVYQAQACTFEDETKFYSYRRDNQTGRMATLIWFNDNSRIKR